MTEKRFTIDVETENYENVYFEEDKFLCFEDDYDCILSKLNELADENNKLKQENEALKHFVKTNFSGMMAEKGKGVKKMMLQLNDDGVLEKVDEEKLITVNTDDLNEFINEKESLEKENNELKDKNSQLQETLAFRSNQLALMEQLIDDLGSEEMERQMKEILND